LAIEAWPEIVVPAYFVTRGGVLYDTIIFPHTPALILFTALAGKLFGFSAPLFRGIVAISMACSGALIAFAARDRMRAFAGTIAFVVFSVFAVAVTLWPDPLMAPIALAAALALERFDDTGSRRELIAGALLFGLCIVTKQTAAWLAIAGALWLVARRARPRDLATYAAIVALPYALFVGGWALWYSTIQHVFWTLIVPLSGHSHEIVAFSPPMLLRMLLVIAAIVLATTTWRSPLPWIALGALGMAWPRVDVLHLSASLAIAGALIARAPLRRLAAVGVLIAIAAVIPRWRLHGPAFFWNDRATSFYTEQVRRRVAPGGAFLNFNTQNETLYAVTGTTTPSGIYVNPKFWYYLNKNGLDERLCRDLASRRGTPILFSYLDARVEDPRSAATCLYGVVARAPVVEPINRATSWRRVP
jgi:hypothetical protein